MGKLLIGLLLLAFVFGGFYYFNGSSTEITGSIVDAFPEKEVFSLEGNSFKFLMDSNENPDIVVKEGDLVRIELENTDSMPHDWVLEGWDVSTSVIGGGETTFVEFVANKKGTFDYYCSVGSHRANGMEGKFIVE